MTDPTAIPAFPPDVIEPSVGLVELDVVDDELLEALDVQSNHIIIRFELKSKSKHDKECSIYEDSWDATISK
ncbi:hypothetical protein G6F68_019457 [Rhizopus microsporus]|nr:hypothetical protein G6F68_019457 [Rhizopus microsporus]